MAETFPETPAIRRKGDRRPPPDFFPTSSKTKTNTKAAAGAGAALPRRSRDDSGSRDDREEYIQVSRGDLDDEVGEDSVAEVRSGRLDTLGWVSASWEPRRVVLRTDGSMSVEPLGVMGAGRARRRSGSREEPTHHHHQHHRHPQQQGGGGSAGANANTAAAAAAVTASKAAKSLGGLAPNWNDPPSPPQWGSVKLKTTNRNVNGSGNGNGNSSGVAAGGGGGGGSTASTSARTEGMTTWASNSSNTSINLRSGTPSRRGGLLAAAMAVAGGGSREQPPVAGSPSSSVASAPGSTEKVMREKKRDKRDKRDRWRWRAGLRHGGRGKRVVKCCTTSGLFLFLLLSLPRLRTPVVFSLAQCCYPS